MKVAFWLSRRTPVRWFSTCGSQAGRTALSRVVAGNVDLLQQETLGRGPAAFNDAPGEAPWSPRATVLNPEVTQAADGSECRGLLAGEFAGSLPLPRGAFRVVGRNPALEFPALGDVGSLFRTGIFHDLGSAVSCCDRRQLCWPESTGRWCRGPEGKGGGAWVSLNSAF